MHENQSPLSEPIEQFRVCGIRGEPNAKVVVLSIKTATSAKHYTMCLDFFAQALDSMRDDIGQVRR